MFSRVHLDLGQVVRGAVTAEDQCHLGQVGKGDSQRDQEVKAVAGVFAKRRPMDGVSYRCMESEEEGPWLRLGASPRQVLKRLHHLYMPRDCGVSLGG